MKHRTSLIIFLTLAAVFTAGCKKAPDYPMQTCKMNVETIVVPYMGASYVVEVDSNASWQLKLDDEWVSASTYESIGSGSFTLYVAENDGDERITTVTLCSADKTASSDLKIVQSGVSSDGYISISTLRSLESESGSVTLSGTSSKVKGFVVTYAEASNYAPNSFAIEDSFSESGCGITVVVEGDYTAFNQGEEVSMTLDGNVLTRDDYGRLALYVADSPQLTEMTPVTITPVEVEYNDLTAGSYESMYVLVSDFQVIEENIDGTLGDSPIFENAAGKRFQVYVSEDASFYMYGYGQGAGTIAGIAGPAGSTPIIQPTYYTDLNLTNVRIGVTPGIRSLPYVFSFYCSEYADATPKYVTYTPVYWDETTLLMKGTVATDNVASNGVYLEMTAYATEISNTVSSGGVTYFKAENGAHDYINASGYVTPDSKKNVAPEECGLWLTVPLQIDMPTDFRVSFGMGGNNWTISNWKLSYSPDKSTWYEAGAYSLDHIVSSNSYYLYFTVPVHLDVPMPSGSTLYLKFTPYGTDGITYSNADGHGSSCYIRLHSAIVLYADPDKDETEHPEAVYFEPFNNLTEGLDYFIGDRLGAFANYCGDDISTWSDEKMNGITGSNVYERPGYAQIGYVETERATSRTGGYTAYVGELETPAIGRSGDFTLSFKAAAYVTPAIRENCNSSVQDIGTPDMTSIVVEIDGEGTVEGETSYTVTSVPTSEFATYTLSLKGVTADTKIRFTSNPGSDDFGSRWFIDDILITE